MKTWRKAKWSTPAYEMDNLRQLTLYSDALGGRGDVTLFLPNGYESASDLPLVMLLHGVTGSHWSWTLNGGAHVVANHLMADGTIPPCVIAMPSDGLWGDGSGYFDHAGGAFEAWIMRDLLGCLYEELDCLGVDSTRYLSGLSMGGFGTLRLGARHPDAWDALSAHSSVIRCDELQAIVPDLHGFEGGTEDPIEYLLMARDDLPRLRFDCGTEDPYIESNRILHHRLREAGIEHVFEEFPGGHNWDYWHEHLADSLRFFFAT